MSNPRRFDCFPFAGTATELLLLECRLTELYDVFDKFVIVEATVDHQNHPKPLHYLEHQDRFEQWKDKIHYVVAESLPDTPHVENPWAREHAQREWIAKGLEELDANDDDIIFQSDADEFPNVVTARNVRPQRNELLSLHQRGHFWAIDWLYPFEEGWWGTVIGRWGGIKTLAQHRPCGPFAAMRDSRNANRSITGGWHFSWLGGTEAIWLAKVNSFCHPEVEARIVHNAATYYREGIHVDRKKMRPVDVDNTWPKWMQDPVNVPAEWLRPR
jgi:hypothetical protein